MLIGKKFNNVRTTRESSVRCSSRNPSIIQTLSPLPPPSWTINTLLPSLNSGQFDRFRVFGRFGLWNITGPVSSAPNCRERVRKVWVPQWDPHPPLTLSPNCSCNSRGSSSEDHFSQR